ncbi:hypothetical protein ACF3DV_07930 [Chlorogloeopsis fritschii PCC 9212]|uniref:Uncharacterized protein n=1 Tax=Chlorogloeopsis fritschii PCC 6912 TaxID=211165 RepID=A0A433N739_CHLFR|nr:hypothetical protein [Chlorogloeopsis fritschii]MBF2008093.1 hypothetical protein [Chlorogloeopsis fritschii C42_A2020_084]RUR77427.1 hypothetical protein PCC6912_38180 [Chlorogloeopsis fritschii PCC 6912]
MCKNFIFSLGTTVFAFFPAISVQASQVELGVFKSVDAPKSNCPQKVIVTEQRAPYYEGGYTVNGQAKLSSFAQPFTLASFDRFSVTWVANLKPAFQKCVAAGGIIKYGNETYNSHSYLRVRFNGGKVYLILDMTGNRDVNNFTPSINKKSVSTGNPTWSWSGSD